MTDADNPDQPVSTSSHPTADSFPQPSPTSPSRQVMMEVDPAPEAGPSRPRRPASPSTAFKQASPPRPSTPHLDLSTYPTTTLLRLLASLLQQIASANDQLRPDLEEMDEDIPPDPTPSSDDAAQPRNRSASNSTTSHRSQHSSSHLPSPQTALFDHPEPHPSPLLATTDLFTASRISLAHPASLLSFHARHIPSISIEAYLLRILKYCPTTNEVFLGLLVYFDRMSRLGTSGGLHPTAAKRGFAIDSYNVHRLVIAGVTVASKFFSDVFYTNSRYAKVGGLPSNELNQLELQFLLLNDFRLAIPTEEMQRYGDRLLSYWEAKEGVDSDSVLPIDDRAPVFDKVATPDPSIHHSQENTAKSTEDQGLAQAQQRSAPDSAPAPMSNTRHATTNPSSPDPRPPANSRVSFDVPRRSKRVPTETANGASELPTAGGIGIGIIAGIVGD